MNATRLTSRFLYFLAVLQILTAGIVIVPLAWLDGWHVWLGLGAMPQDAVLRYVLRAAGYVQGGIGVLLWIMATDVVRYRPLIVAVGAIYLIGSPVFYFIETQAQMPFFWIMLDCVSTFVVGAGLLVLCRRSPTAVRVASGANSP